MFIPLLAILVRIHIEEAKLATALGPEYTRYTSRTPAAGSRPVVSHPADAPSTGAIDRAAGAGLDKGG